MKIYVYKSSPCDDSLISYCLSQGEPIICIFYSLFKPP